MYLSKCHLDHDESTTWIYQASSGNLSGKLNIFSNLYSLLLTLTSGHLFKRCCQTLTLPNVNAAYLIVAIMLSIKYFIRRGLVFLSTSNKP